MSKPISEKMLKQIMEMDLRSFKERDKQITPELLAKQQKQIEERAKPK